MVGSAWCLADDLDRARAIYPDAPVIAVNGAAREVEALLLYSMHPEHFETGHRWARWQRRRFHGEFTVHTSDREGNADQKGVDHVWPDARGGGGSAWGARKVAWLIGFDTVVLCGSPLDVGNYAQYRPGGLMTRPHVVDDMRAGLAKETEWHSGAVSMSGWTAKLLGSP